MLALAGSISGAVTDARTGLPVAHACAYALDPRTGRLGGYDSSGLGGAYRVVGLRPGRWHVRFVDCGANVAVPEYWDDSLTAAGATPVTVTEGSDRAGVDAAVLLLTVPSVPRLPQVVLDDSGAVVSWQPPLDDGSSPVTAYEVLDDAGAVVGRATGTATSLRVAARADRPASFSVRAVNVRGAGPPTAATSGVPGSAVPTPAPGPTSSPVAPGPAAGSPVAVPATPGTPVPATSLPASAVPLRATPASPTAGSPVQVSGQGPAGAAVELWAYSRPRTTYARVRRGTVDRDGHWSFDLRPTTSTRLFAHVLGGGVTSDSLSLGVPVRAAVRMTARRTSPTTWTASGTALPARPGRPVVLVRGSVPVARGTTDARGGFTVRFHPPRGTSAVTALVAADDRNAAGRGPTVRLDG